MQKQTCLPRGRGMDEEEEKRVKNFFVVVRFCQELKQSKTRQNKNLHTLKPTSVDVKAMANNCLLCILQITQGIVEIVSFTSLVQSR